MKYKVTKLDYRYSHRTTYQYMIEFSKGHWIGTGVLIFDRARKWFTTNYGWGQDVEVRSELLRVQQHHAELFEPDDINDAWAFSAKYNDYRIYVATDKELSWFLLCHPASQ
jgi:hypothetical protein